MAAEGGMDLEPSERMQIMTRLDGAETISDELEMSPYLRGERWADVLAGAYLGRECSDLLQVNPPDKYRHLRPWPCISPQFAPRMHPVDLERLRQLLAAEPPKDRQRGACL